ncbi:sulfotransferase 2A, ARABIDOPSIS THALIANA SULFOTRANSFERASE 2A [Hibiscus trionum]|uniref:Sulfotransferase n=1 Tax=Hibiscus trionum TaxID=183268 RepID=A0A9W7GVX4_HIBTR|nr:sulfotransferase 2A, ARABIDOPSIS THALIANA SULFOTRANSFERASE 2A [Hibiscus trionum]
MAIPHLAKIPTIDVGEDEEDLISNECKELIHSCPKEKGWRTSFLYKFQGFWCQSKEIQAIISFQKHFRAKSSDVILATIPKSGTTWIKALTFAIMNRKSFPISNENHPLLASNPHDLVPFLEYKLYANNRNPDLSNILEPRIFGTHVPYGSLRESIKSSDCRVVYVCRNPFDTFISSWHYCIKLRLESQPPLPLEEAFDMYCKGVIGFGPFWEHMLGYWKESLARPNNVLFMKYEDMKEDAISHLKKLANFLGVPFSIEEEKAGLVEEIMKLCSFGNLKDLEVNKSGKSIKDFDNKYLFRKGEIGDWVNYLSPSMVEKLSKIMEDKFGDSGLKFKVLSSVS